MADPYPVYSEFKRNPPIVGGQYLGCAVCSTASIIQRYTGKVILNLSALGKSMRTRHRNATPGTVCGSVVNGVPHGWDNFCMSLELRARGIPAVYAALDWEGVKDQLDKGHPCALAIWYGDIPKIGRRSYSRTVPARGRSDTYISGHSVVAWAIDRSADPDVFIVTDPDFGSDSRPRIPPHSRLRGPDLRDGFERLSYRTTFINKRPPG